MGAEVGCWMWDVGGWRWDVGGRICPVPICPVPICPVPVPGHTDILYLFLDGAAAEDVVSQVVDY